MPTTLRNSTSHEIEVAAPANRVYELLADVENWPAIFPPTIHAVSEPVAEDEELLHIWATAGDHVKSWTSHRRLRPSVLRIDFTQVVPTAPITEMSGTWIVEPRGAMSSIVRLLHHYAADAEEDIEWIDRTVDINSRSELHGLKVTVEADQGRTASRFDFVDEFTIEGRLHDVYDFINQADKWAQRLPHVATVRLTEATAGVQFLEMDTRSPDGSTHSTASYRICFEPERIVYKQVTLPALMQMHGGQWTFTQVEGHVVASSAHSVVIEPEYIKSVLGPEATLDDAKAYVRNALSSNSRATLGYAREYAEALRSQPASQTAGR